MVDMHTGRVLCVQYSHEDLLEKRWERLTRIETPQGPVFLEKGLNFDDTQFLKPEPFSQMLADLLCEEIAKGSTLVAACEKTHLNYSTVLKWKRESQSFKEALLQAEKDRADSIHDEVLDEARKYNTDAKTKIAALSWSAERLNAEKYGTKTKITGDANAPLTFFIETGVRRSGDAGFIAPPEETTPGGPALQGGQEKEGFEP